MTQTPNPTALRIPHPRELAATYALAESLPSQHPVDLLDHGICIYIRLGVFSGLTDRERLPSSSSLLDTQ